MRREQLRELVDDAERFGIKAGDIPRQVGRPASSLAKLLDEYNWVTITIVPEPGLELLQGLGAIGPAHLARLRVGVFGVNPIGTGNAS